MLLTICKLLCLFLGILYGFGNLVRAKRNLQISSQQMILMAIGVVGFIGLEFYM